MKAQVAGELSAVMGIRVRVPDTGTAPARDRFYTIEQLCEQFYRWGRNDERDRQDGTPPAGLGAGWTIGGVSLDTLRSSTEQPRRD